MGERPARRGAGPASPALVLAIDVEEDLVVRGGAGAKGGVESGEGGIVQQEAARAREVRMHTVSDAGVELAERGGLGCGRLVAVFGRKVHARERSVNASGAFRGHRESNL